MVCSFIQLKLVNFCYQRTELMCDTNGNHGGPVGDECCSESFLDFFCGVRCHSDTTKGIGRCDDIESGQIKRGHIGSLLKNCKLFENGVLVIARNDIDKLELLPRGRIKALYRILQSSIPAGRDDRAPGSQLLLGNCNADRGGFSPSESATRKGVVRTRLVDRPVLREIPKVR